MQCVYGIHAVESLLRQNPKSVQRLLLQAGRDDKRVTALLALAHNQGVSVVRESRAGLDKIVSARHQGAVAQLRGLRSAWARSQSALRIGYQVQQATAPSASKAPVA